MERLGKGDKVKREKGTASKGLKRKKREGQEVRMGRGKGETEVMERECRRKVRE